jgi:hypothetical protein
VFEDAGNIRKIHAEGTIGEIFNKVETTFH